MSSSQPSHSVQDYSVFASKLPLGATIEDYRWLEHAEQCIKEGKPYPHQIELTNDKRKCDVCRRQLKAWTHTVSRVIPGIWCSWRCLQRQYMILEAEQGKPRKERLLDKWEVSAQRCLCDPCPHDITKLFSGAKKFYESPDYQGCKCKWHWEVRGKVKSGSRWVDLSACISGPDLLYVTYEDRARNHRLVGACDVPIDLIPELRKLIKWRTK